MNSEQSSISTDDCSLFTAYLLCLSATYLLNQLNHHFYSDHALAFAERRRTLQPGAQRIVARIPSGARVLDVGCGDGKVWPALGGRAALYCGVDGSEELLQKAEARIQNSEIRSQTSEDNSLTSNPPIFFHADLTDPAWANLLPPEPFTHILAFAVLHHIPGYATRLRLIRELAARLAPGGVCVMSNWQFTRRAKLREHIRPWSTLNLTAAEVEPGDYLLAWERKGKPGLRYVHLLDEAEAQRLAADAGLLITEIFQADGVTHDLTDYVEMRRKDEG